MDPVGSTRIRHASCSVGAVPTKKSVLVGAVEVAVRQWVPFSAMISVLRAFLLTLRTAARSRAALQFEILALRHQLDVLQRTRPRRLRLSKADRWLWGLLSRICLNGERRS